MAAPWMQPDLAVILTVGVGGSALGLVGLVRARSPSGRVGALALAATLLVGLFFCLAALLGQPAAIWLPPAALLGLWWTLHLLRGPLVARLALQAGRLVRSPRFPASALLVGCPLVAGLWMHNTTEAEYYDPTLEVAGRLDFTPGPLAEVPDSPVRTDRGRPVKLQLRQSAPDATPALLARQSDILRNAGLSEQVINLPLALYEGNCHGWVFTGGRYWLAPAEVENILADNGYEHVDVPRPGDLVVYRNVGGEIIHTGIVRTADDAIPVLIESKWGGMGRFIHPVDAHLYDAAECEYYRSPRSGHLLHGLPGAPTPKPDDGAPRYR